MFKVSDYQGSTEPDVAGAEFACKKRDRESIAELKDARVANTAVVTGRHSVGSPWAAEPLHLSPALQHLERTLVIKQLAPQSNHTSSPFPAALHLVSVVRALIAANLLEIHGDVPPALIGISFQFTI